MNRKWTLAIVVLAAVIFGIFGIYMAIDGILTGYGPEYAVGALIPFIICVAVVVYQHGKLHTMRRLAQFCLVICFTTVILSMTGLGMIYAPSTAGPGSFVSLVTTIFLLNLLVVVVGGVILLLEILNK